MRGKRGYLALRSRIFDRDVILRIAGTSPFHAPVCLGTNSTVKIRPSRAAPRPQDVGTADTLLIALPRCMLGCRKERERERVGEGARACDAR